MAATLPELEREVARLRDQLDAVKREIGVVAGMLTINRPLQHLGELLGFFGTPPNTQAAAIDVSAGTLAEAEATLASIVAVLERYGLVRS